LDPASPTWDRSVGVSLRPLKKKGNRGTDREGGKEREREKIPTCAGDPPSPQACNQSVSDGAMNRIPQAQLGIVLLECPWDPLKKEGVEGHRERGWEREREREREKIPTTVQGGSTPPPQACNQSDSDDAMNRIPQAQLGIVLLECPWDPLKKEGVEGHSRECRREREREGIPTWTEDPCTLTTSMQSIHPVMTR
jgi:hypothetical protein